MTDSNLSLRFSTEKADERANALKADLLKNNAPTLRGVAHENKEKLKKKLNLKQQ